MEDNLTRTQRRAIPLILAQTSIEAGCRSAGIARQTFYKWLPPAPPPRLPGRPRLCPQDEGDDGGGGPARRTGADRRAEGREGMMEGIGSFSIDCEGRGLPENSKNCHLLSLPVTLGTPQKTVFP